MNDYNLDVCTADEVSEILNKAAFQYRESASELTSAWQDPKADIIWKELARILERAADQCEKSVKKHFSGSITKITRTRRVIGRKEGGSADKELEKIKEEISLLHFRMNKAIETLCGEVDDLCEDE